MLNADSFIFSRLFCATFIFIWFEQIPPTRCRDTAFLCIKWWCRSLGHITCFFFSFLVSLAFIHTIQISSCFLHHNTSVRPGHCWVVVLSARAWRTQPLIYASPLWPAATTVLFAVLQLYRTPSAQIRCSSLFCRVGGAGSILSSLIYSNFLNFFTS